MVGWAVVLFGIALSAAAIQINLINGQRELDRIEARISRERLRQDELRQQEANLRSPAKIVQIATDDLQMVPAATPVMVPAGAHRIGDPVVTQAASVSTQPAASASTAGSESDSTVDAG